MTFVKFRLGWVTLVSVMMLSACASATDSATPTPHQASINAAGTLFAPPPEELSSTPTITPASAIELDLNLVIAQMEQAVLAGDVAAYLAHVWTGDARFLAEHTRWAEDWRDYPLSTFDLALYGIEVLDDTRVSARLTMRWSQRGAVPGDAAGGATASVLFYRVDGAWQLGSERWQAATVDGIRLYYFADALVDNRAQAEEVLTSLPEIVTAVTREFDHVPAQDAHIRLYDSPVTLQNWTRLSMPVVDAWQIPGESIKVAVEPLRQIPPDAPLLAREYARFVVYSLAEQPEHIPWWLVAGCGELGAAQFRPPGYGDQVVADIASDAAQTRLLAWDDLASPPARDDQQRAIYQSFALVQYVTEVYGATARNDWIKTITAGQSVDAASQTMLGVDFAVLDQAWRAWLAESSG